MDKGLHRCAQNYIKCLKTLANKDNGKKYCKTFISACYKTVIYRRILK